MEPLVFAQDLERLFAGSHEERMAKIGAKVAASIGESAEDLRVLASYPERMEAVFMVGGRVVKASWADGEDSLKIEQAPVSIVRGEGDVVEISKILRALAREVVEGKGRAIDCASALVALSALLDESTPYTMASSFEQIREVAMDRSRAWRRYYDENRDEIRRALHGRLGKIESRLPRTKFARVSRERLADFEKEIRESLSTILDEVAGAIRRIESGLALPDEIAESALADCRVVEGAIRVALGLCESREDLERLARINDNLLPFVADLAIITRHGSDE